MLLSQCEAETCFEVKQLEVNVACIKGPRYVHAVKGLPGKASLKGTIRGNVRYALTTSCKARNVVLAWEDDLDARRAVTPPINEQAIYPPLGTSKRAYVN